nr:PREDICTED: uncharacterized protein LOC103556293 [Equus przewalskii]
MNASERAKRLLAFILYYGGLQPGCIGGWVIYSGSFIVGSICDLSELWAVRCTMRNQGFMTSKSLPDLDFITSSTSDTDLPKLCKFLEDTILVQFSPMPSKQKSKGLSYPWLWKNLRNSAHLEKMHGMSCSPLPFTVRPSSCLKEFTVFAGRQDKCTDIRKRCGECQEQEKWPNVQWEFRAMPMEARTRLKMVKMMTSKKPALKLKASWHDGKGVNIKAKLPRAFLDNSVKKGRRVHIRGNPRSFVDKNVKDFQTSYSEATKVFQVRNRAMLLATTGSFPTMLFALPGLITPVLERMPLSIDGGNLIMVLSSPGLGDHGILQMRKLSRTRDSSQEGDFCVSRSAAHTMNPLNPGHYWNSYYSECLKKFTRQQVEKSNYQAEEVVFTGFTAPKW